MKKKAKVYLIDAQLSKLYLGPTNKMGLEEDPYGVLKSCTPKHIYFTSDEEIKEPCWAINMNGDTLYYIEDITPHTTTIINSNWNKVIATTNPELWYEKRRVDIFPIADKLVIPKIGDDFVEAYIKAYNEGKPITEVNLEYTYQCDNGHFMSYQGACTYPHCHNSNELKINIRSNGTVIISPVVEKMYSRDEMLDIMTDYEMRMSGYKEKSKEWYKERIDAWLRNHYPQ